MAILIQPNLYADSIDVLLQWIIILSDSSGLPLDSHLLYDTGNGIYITLTVVPTQAFRIQVTGSDASGKYLSRIGSTIRPSDIELTLGKKHMTCKHLISISHAGNACFYPLVLLPGERKNCTLLLHNSGSRDTFIVSATADKNATFTFSTVKNVAVSYLETVSFNIQILASKNGTDGLPVGVTVTVGSLNRSDSVTFVTVYSLQPLFHPGTKEVSQALVIRGNESNPISFCTPPVVIELYKRYNSTDREHGKYACRCK